MFSNKNFLEHHELYTLEFKFLPEIFALYEKTKKNPGVNFDEMKLIDIKFIKNQFESKYIDWDTFKFEKKELTNNVKEYIYSFGEPKDVPLCYFSIFYMDQDNNIFEYFTLEKTSPSMLGPGLPYICGQKGSQHINYGITCSPNIESFEKAIQTIVNKRVKPINGFNSETFEYGVPKRNNNYF